MVDSESTEQTESCAMPILPKNRRQWTDIPVVTDVTVTCYVLPMFNEREVKKWTENRSVPRITVNEKGTRQREIRARG